MAKIPGGGDTVRYSDRVQQGKQDLNAIKGRGKPLGGAPPIPPGKLDKVFMTEPNFDDDDGEPDPLPNDFTPPQMSGVGSGLAVNQAAAAGAQRSGPMSMAEAKRQGLSGKAGGGISEETKHLLENAELVTDGGGSGKETVKEGLDRADKEIVEDEHQQIALDLEGLTRLRSVLETPERQKMIESRLEPLDITDILTKREIQQEITIIPGQLRYRMRTFSEAEYMWCLQKVYESAGSAAYLEELLNTFVMTCSLVEINGKPLSDHRKDGKIEHAAFEKKHRLVTSFPSQMLADLGVQYNWFSSRVTKLFTVEQLKNG